MTHASALLCIGLSGLACGQAPFPTMASVQGRMPCGSCAAPASLNSSAQLASPSEPGTWIRISGRVFMEDGRTPAPGITLFLYQTDASGHYNRQDDPKNPRIRGWVQTDGSGAYEFVTIKPGPYPSHREPAHIHVHLFGPNLPEWFNDDFWFSDDPTLTPLQRAKAQALGPFSNLVDLHPAADGLMTGHRDVRIRRRPGSRP